ncbi:MAG: hypothetical protein C4520_12715 [Candidatus Abyssobacteria bacterium SURF_5]|uniref:Uncharacterized protein n=1 Tax=Abyssobacteria bacterium (strain SURF_5) TaxID=2093360 RepID=A0A3A4NVF9_ABYX5|nr:MAG: hypothetical protein C4520_12715 [Candidatus Abyssubacteria bacterium SURF_5]
MKSARPEGDNCRCRRRVVSCAAFLALAVFASCASGPPVRVGVDQVLDQPQAFKNERVELTGFVEDLKPVQGDVYRTLFFTLAGHPDGEILVSGAGYTAEAIAKASFLVQQAYEEHEPVTIVGKLKVDEKAPPELKLESIRYRGQEVEIKSGPTTRPGRLSIGGGVVTGSVGIGATIHP